MVGVSCRLSSMNEYDTLDIPFCRLGTHKFASRAGGGTTNKVIGQFYILYGQFESLCVGIFLCVSCPLLSLRPLTL